MFAVTVHFRLKPDRMAAFWPLMIENASRSKEDETGCHVFDVCRNDKTQEVFLYELYADRASFDAHLATPHFLSFDAAVSDMIEDKTVATYMEVMR